MPKYIVDLDMDGYDTEEIMAGACEEFIYEQLDMTASAVKVIPITEDEYRLFMLERKLLAGYKDDKHPIITTYKLEDFDNNGDYFTLKDFIQCVKDGEFIDDDGCGELCIGKKKTDVYIDLNDLENLDPVFDGVMWYNK